MVAKHVLITQRKNTDRGGYICLPLKKNVQVGRPGWELINCPACGEECWKDPMVAIVEKSGAVALCTMCALKVGSKIMMKCSKEAWMSCPTHDYCGWPADFVEGSDCEKFNEKFTQKGGNMDTLNGKIKELSREAMAQTKFQLQLQKELDRYKWIPVAERLPTEPEDCCEAFLTTDGVFIHIQYYLGNGEWLMTDSESGRPLKNCLPSATHWMQLPDPPEVAR